MAIYAKPQIVSKKPRPVLRPMTLEWAAGKYPDSPVLQARLLAAVKYLRERSKCGWVMDKGSTPRFRSDAQ